MVGSTVYWVRRNSAKFSDGGIFSG
eukprot:SAG11_NODE_30149_length_303_cov_1.627451_1_plen_24_part_01